MIRLVCISTFIFCVSALHVFVAPTSATVLSLAGVSFFSSRVLFADYN